MDSESQIALLLARVDTGMKELERTVEHFEQTVSQAEQWIAEAEADVAGKPPRTEPVESALPDVLEAGRDAATLVRAANTVLDLALAEAEIAASAAAPAEDAAPLSPGTLICDGRYRLVQLLYSRPRVHLYLARRQSTPFERTKGDQPLVVIRELLLHRLVPAVRQHLVRAAFEEFAAPQLFGSPHLPGVGDHVYLEDERHYLVMQPRQVRGLMPALAELLSERLTHAPQLDLTTALHLGTRLCQTMVRLHRLNLYLGELTPAMLLVDHVGDADWAPLLLASWPPAPQFWPGQSKQTAQRAAEQIFPSVEPGQTPTEQDSHAFAAPEIFRGQRDAAADVYALGAILYLLCTGSPPAAASQRQRDEEARQQARSERPPARPSRHTRRSQPPSAPVPEVQPVLTPPHLLNTEISPLLEQIILRALALEPEQRFASVRDMAEALESMHLKAELSPVPAVASPFPRAKTSRLRRLFEWLRR